MEAVAVDAALREAFFFKLPRKSRRNLRQVTPDKPVLRAEVNIVFTSDSVVRQLSTRDRRGAFAANVTRKTLLCRSREFLAVREICPTTHSQFSNLQTTLTKLTKIDIHSCSDIQTTSNLKPLTKISGIMTAEVPHPAIFLISMLMFSSACTFE